MLPKKRERTKSLLTTSIWSHNQADPLIVSRYPAVWTPHNYLPTDTYPIPLSIWIIRVIQPLRLQPSIPLFLTFHVFLVLFASPGIMVPRLFSHGAFVITASWWIKRAFLRLPDRLILSTVGVITTGAARILWSKRVEWRCGMARSGWLWNVIIGRRSDGGFPGTGLVVRTGRLSVVIAEAIVVAGRFSGGHLQMGVMAICFEFLVPRWVLVGHGVSVRARCSISYTPLQRWVTKSKEVSITRMSCGRGNMGNMCQFWRIKLWDGCSL